LNRYNNININFINMKIVSYLRRSWILAGFVMASSMSAQNLVHTIDGNPDIPGLDIRAFYRDEAWKMIKDAPYQGYVVVKGTVNPRGEFHARRVESSYPDDSKNDLAFKMSEEVKISSAKVGTRIDPKASVYVIFYEENPEQKVALVFGKRDKSIGFQENSIRGRYMSLFAY